MSRLVVSRDLDNDCRTRVIMVDACARPQEFGGVVTPSLEPPIPMAQNLSDADWSAQNRKINDLLSGRAG